MRICLVGNPNCGKSTLFNVLTGLNQKVGNYAGVTVDRQSGRLNLNGSAAELIDLPGTYSLYPKSLDEAIVFNTLLNEESKSHPDLVVLVANATMLRRSMVLVSQVIDLGLPCILAVNMMDEARKSNVSINAEILEKQLGIPVHLISATKQSGIKALKSGIETYTAPDQQDLQLRNLGEENIIREAQTIIEQGNHYSTFVNLVLAEKSKNITAAQRIQLLELRVRHEFNPTSEMAKDINGRFKYINEVMATMSHSVNNGKSALSLTQKLDKVFTNKWLGLPLAFGILFLIFQAIFDFAEYPMAWIETGFGFLGQLITSNFPESWFRDMIVEGLLAGLSGVLVFIPQIAILFGLLAILEGTGYMARISYMLDRLMRKFGLSGKAVVPMMSGFACAIPAIMAARNIKSWKERLITIMVTPLLSCSARLPVYVLLIGMMVPSKKVWGIFNLKGLTMMGFYLAGIVLAILVAGILSLLLRVKETTPFIMEMPRYRLPQWRNVLLTMYQKAKIFTLEAGKVIMVISIILWILASYGPGKKMQAIETKYEQLANGTELEGELLKQYQQEKLTNSFAGHIGKAIEPAIKPLGYDWKIGIALITSFAAREVFVGTMATIYSVDADEDNPQKLQEKLLAEKDPKTGKPIYTVATVFSLLLFYAFAMQCMSTLAVVYRETKSWKWPAIQLVYLTALAYGTSFIAYQLLS